jgi:hypothetical protein
VCAQGKSCAVEIEEFTLAQMKAIDEFLYKNISEIENSPRYEEVKTKLKIIMDDMDKKLIFQKDNIKKNIQEIKLIPVILEKNNLDDAHVFAVSENQINLISISEATKYCSYKINKGTGFNLKKIGFGKDSMHRNINNEFTEINNCSELKLGYNNETWEEISALEFCEKYFDGTRKNTTTKSLILTKYPECIISETPFRLEEFTKQELIENNLVSRLDYEDSLLKINEYIEVSQNKILIKNNQINKKENKKNLVTNKTVDTFTFCERSKVSLYYMIKDRGCLENDSEMSRGDFEYLVRNFDTIINCEVKDGVENCKPNILMSYTEENCTKHSNKKINYNEDDSEVLLSCRGPIDKKNYIFEENITAERNINESNKSSEKVKAETNIDKVSLKKELEYWKELYDDELITKAEYDAKRKELLNQPITKTKVNSSNSINNNSNQTKKTIKEVSIDKSYQNKNYLYPKIDRKFFAMNTNKILRKCMGDYNSILEQIKCSEDNIKATHRYKKRDSYFDIYQLHVSTLASIENMILSGQISEIEARTEVSSLNNRTISQINIRWEADSERNRKLGEMGQKLADPNYDITTGTYKNQNNNNTFQNQNNQSCMFNPATGYYQICLHKGAAQYSCFHFGNQCTP